MAAKIISPASPLAEDGGGTADLASKVQDSNIVRKKQDLQRIHANPSSTFIGDLSRDDRKIPANTYTTPTKFTPTHTFHRLSHSHSLPDLNPTQPTTPVSENPNFGNTTLTSEIKPMTEVKTHGGESMLGPISPSISRASPSRKLQEVFQEEGKRLDSADRLVSLVGSIEDELLKSGISVSFAKFKDSLIQIQEAGPESEGTFDLEGEYVTVEEKKNPRPPEPKLFPPQGATNRNWNSLFKAQAPIKSLKLAHYPEFQKGKDSHVSFDESQIDVGLGNHCLVGHFLDGNMPLPLLTATARAVWKDFGKFSIKQLGSCYLFEFEDEESKMGVLEGGPYFFSRRYLVLKEWKRMLVPSKNHPTTIPVWVKLHRLPLEFWTHVGFSMIASAIGKPIHIDEATANKRRLDFARVCVEINAGDELPTDITISVKDESVMIGVEYQWLPSRCEKCKVFGHTCDVKAVPKATSHVEEWTVVGKGKLSSTGAVTGNQQGVEQ